MDITSEAAILFGFIRPGLVGSLTLYCGDPAVAEDLAQEALARAWMRWRHVSTLDAPERWVYRTAFNLARSRFRRLAVERRLHRMAPAVPALPDTATAVAVRAAVAALPPGSGPPSSPATTSTSTWPRRPSSSAASRGRSRPLPTRPSPRCGAAAWPFPRRWRPMAELGDLLREAVGEVGTASWSVDDVARRAHRGRRRRRVGRVMATVAVVVAAAVGVLSADDRSAVEVVGQPDPSREQPVFSSPTGVVLLFDDGYDGVTALDLDAGVVGRRVVDGQRAGDQPYRLFRSGDSLIVGWGEVFAAPLDGGPSVSLGEATIAVPASESGRVWLATWAGGSVGSGPLTMRLVDLQGRVEHTLVGEGTAVGVPGGVMFDGPGGTEVRSFRGAEVTGIGGDGRVLGVGSVFTVTCSAGCEVLTVGRPGFPLPVPAGVPLGDVPPADVVMSPDGARLALVTPGPAPRLMVLDLPTSRLAVDEPVDGLAFPTWSSDSNQLFWVASSYGEASTVVGRIDVDAAAAESVRLPFGGTFRAIAVDRSEAASFLPATPPADPSACPPPTLQPSHRTGTCGFRIPAP